MNEAIKKKFKLILMRMMKGEYYWIWILNSQHPWLTDGKKVKWIEFAMTIKPTHQHKPFLSRHIGYGLLLYSNMMIYRPVSHTFVDHQMSKFISIHVTHTYSSHIKISHTLPLSKWCVHHITLNRLTYRIHQFTTFYPFMRIRTSEYRTKFLTRNVSHISSSIQDDLLCFIHESYTEYRHSHTHAPHTPFLTNECEYINLSPNALCVLPLLLAFRFSFLVFRHLLILSAFQCVIIAYLSVSRDSL